MIVECPYNWREIIQDSFTASMPFVRKLEINNHGLEKSVAVTCGAKHRIEMNASWKSLKILQLRIKCGRNGLKMVYTCPIEIFKGTS